MFLNFVFFILCIYFPHQSCAKSSLSIRLSISNDGSSTSLNNCNFVSVAILSTGETIYLREMTGTIFRPAVQLPGQTFPKICLYQEVTVNTSRLVSLSSTNNTFNAFITIGNSSFYIDHGIITEALKGIELSPYEDLVKDKGKDGVCGVATVSSNIRAQLLDSKVSYYNSSMTDYYVELYVVADYDMYLRWGTATEAAVYSIINYVNALYRGQGVHIFVVGIEVWRTGNLITIVADSATTLSNLVVYRTSLTTPHDVIHMISGFTFNNGVLGLAYVGGMCQFTYSAGFSTDRALSSYAMTASTMAHEMGHNFGLNHDTSDCTCSTDAYCIMNAYSYSNSLALRWSNCSLNVLNKNFPLLQSVKCLQNVPNLLTINNANLCGNGVVDVNEDCDPGIWPVTSNCCDPTTCKFISSAQCASGRCCDKTTCQPLTAGTQCRSAANQCDLPEYCDGITEFCPDDRYKMNGITCDSSKGYCYNGYCSSHNLQCQQTLSATSTSSSALCYSLNSQSTSFYHGYCTYTFTGISSGSAYYKWGTCSASNVNCGLLHCTNYTSNQIYVGFSIKVNSETCNHALFNTNLTGVRDPSLVQNGALCSTGKWCINSVCQTADSLPAGCSCSSHGKCNDLSNCHCDSGYSDSNCATASGCGGSVDSGPVCANYTVPSVCPTNYCQNGGTCVLNSDGTQCSFAAPYCCRCSGNYLEANCAKTATKSSLLMITSNTTFISDYMNSSSAAFKLFGQTLCQMVRVSFRRYLGTTGFGCQIWNITAGSAIGAVLILGDNYLPSNGYTIADSVTKYCRRNDNSNPSICSNNIVKFINISASGTPTNICATANLCKSNYVCTPMDSISYVCSCPSGYRNDSSVCTEICYSNVIQCSSNSVCQENSGTTISCKCNDGYSGQRCDTQTSSNTIIIGVVVGVGSFLILLAIAVIIMWKWGYFSSHAEKQSSSHFTPSAPPDDSPVYVIQSSTPNTNQVAPLQPQRQDNGYV